MWKTSEIFAGFSIILKYFCKCTVFKKFWTIFYFFVLFLSISNKMKNDTEMNKKKLCRQVDTNFGKKIIFFFQNIFLHILPSSRECLEVPVLTTTQ